MNSVDIGLNSSPILINRFMKKTAKQTASQLYPLLAFYHPTSSFPFVFNTAKVNGWSQVLGLQCAQSLAKASYSSTVPKRPGYRSYVSM